MREIGWPSDICADTFNGRTTSMVDLHLYNMANITL